MRIVVEVFSSVKEETNQFLILQKKDRQRRPAVIRQFSQFWKGEYMTPILQTSVQMGQGKSEAIDKEKNENIETGGGC